MTEDGGRQTASEDRVRARMFRARDALLVICHLSFDILNSFDLAFELCHLTFEILPSASNLQPFPLSYCSTE